ASRCPPDPASFSSARSGGARALHSFPTRRSSDLLVLALVLALLALVVSGWKLAAFSVVGFALIDSMELWKDSMDSLALVIVAARSEEHTSELQSRENLVCRLLLEKKNHPVGSHLA